jgi:hypothetical protein
MTTEQQLSFNIAPKQIRRGGRQEPADVLGGELKLKGALRVDESLNHGDELLVTVADRDGRIISRAYLEVDRPPTFTPIEEKDIGLIGYSRVHTAAVSDVQPSE